MSSCDCDAVKEKVSLTSFDEAIESLLSSAKAIQTTESVDTASALGRVLAESLVSSINVPPLDNSAMDGYAIMSQDITQCGVTLPVSQRICAGEVGQPLQAGTAARIFTGAPVPENADAVVMQEFCERVDDNVTINQEVKSQQNIRNAGEDIAENDEILTTGTYLRAQELGLAASIGCSPLTVFNKIKEILNK